MSEGNWVHACALDELEEEDVLSVKIGVRTYAVYRLAQGVFATDDRCTHAFAKMSSGVVIGDVIECPLHQGRFHIPTGEPRGGPVCAPLATFSTRVVEGKIYIQVAAG